MAKVCLGKLLVRKPAGFLGIVFLGIQFVICSFVHAATPEAKITPATDISSLLHSEASAKLYRSFYHNLDSGLKVRGIKVTDQVYLTRYKQNDGHISMGLSLSRGEYLYQLAADHLSVSFLF